MNNILTVNTEKSFLTTYYESIFCIIFTFSEILFYLKTLTVNMKKGFLATYYESVSFAQSVLSSEIIYLNFRYYFIYDRLLLF